MDAILSESICKLFVRQGYVTVLTSHIYKLFNRISLILMS